MRHFIADDLGEQLKIVRPHGGSRPAAGRGACCGSLASLETSLTFAIGLLRRRHVVDQRGKGKRRA